MRQVRSGTKIADKIFTVATGVCASSPIVFLVSIAAMVLVQSIPSVRLMGWKFITHTQWNLGNLYGTIQHIHGVSAMQGATFGALVFIFGTLVSSVIAILIAVPISIFTAVILAYQVRGRVRLILSILVELLAGIPSVIFGLWGMVVMVPWMKNSLGPLLTHIGVVIPYFKGPVGTGLGLLTSGIVLALMIVPIITSTARDLLQQVPALYREGGLGVGMTTWEVVRLICLPYVKDGMVGAIALGWGRAMGETMAVLMVSGGAMNHLPQNIYSPTSTMAATIASQLDSALSDASHMGVHALSELALLLLVLTLLTNLLARWLVSRTGRSRRLGAGVKA